MAYLQLHLPKEHNRNSNHRIFECNRSCAAGANSEHSNHNTSTISWKWTRSTVNGSNRPGGGATPTSRAPTTAFPAPKAAIAQNSRSPTGEGIGCDPTISGGVGEQRWRWKVPAELVFGWALLPFSGEGGALLWWGLIWDCFWRQGWSIGGCGLSCSGFDRSDEG